MVEVSFRFAYLILCFPFIVVWLALFAASKDTRKEQLTVSLFAMVIGPLSELLYFRDYWLPQSILPIYIGPFPFMVEDILFGFAIGGIGAVIYEVILRKKLSDFSVPSKRIIKAASLALVFAVATAFLLMLGVNSIYATSIAFVVAAMLMIYARRDLFLNAVGSGLGVMVVMFLSYLILVNVFVSNIDDIFRQGWHIYGTALDIRLWGIPLTEMIWGFTWGFFAGPWYEFINGKKAV